MSIKPAIACLSIFIILGFYLGFPQECGSERSDRIEELIRILGTRNWDRAVSELAQIGEPAVEQLVRVLNSNIRFASARSCYALTQIGTEEAVDAVLEALKNPKSPVMVREYAALALGDVKSDKSILFLCKTLENDDAWRVRMFAAQALGKIGSEKAVETLLVSLEDKSEYVRGTAARGLGKFKSSQTSWALARLLRDESGFVRDCVRPALVEMGDPAVEPLLGMLKDKDNGIRWMAVWILGNIQSVQAFDKLIDALKDPDWMVREEAAVALARIGHPESVGPLLELLKDERSCVRENSAWILGKMKADMAVKHLIQALADGESGWMAAAALGEIQSQESLESLIEALESRNIRLRRASAWALGRIPSDKAVASLVKILDDKDWELRMWAALALKKIGASEDLKAIKKIE